MEDFNKKAFLAWLGDKFDKRLPLGWHYELMKNIVEYGLMHQNHSKDQLAYFLSDIIPEIEFEDVARFCDNSILTSNHKHTDGYEMNIGAIIGVKSK